MSIGTDAVGDVLNLEPSFNRIFRFPIARTVNYELKISVGLPCSVDAKLCVKLCPKKQDTIHLYDDSFWNNNIPVNTEFWWKYSWPQ
jgi:hypothetical protein